MNVISGKSSFPFVQISISLLALFTSCNLQMSEEEKTKHIMEAPSIDKSLKETVDNISLEYSLWPDRNWWEKYESEELNHLIELALVQNPTIQSVKTKIEFAKSQAKIARSKLFPFLYFNAQDDWHYLSKNGVIRKLNPTFPINAHFVDLSLSFNYEFDFWYKYRNLYRSALGETQAAIAETAQAELITTTSLAQSYFALKVNLLRQKLYEKLYQVRKDYFLLQQEMMKNSLYAQFEPLLSEEDVFDAEQLLLNINQEVEVSKHAVNIIAGRGPDQDLDLEEGLPTLPPKLAVPYNISIELLSRRPDLMAQIWRVEALALKVGAAKAEFWPNIDLAGLIGLSSVDYGKIFAWSSKTANLFPALKLPVYTSGAIGANVSAKKASFYEAVFNYNEMILQSFQQVADLLVMGKAIYEEQQKQQDIIQSALKRYELTLQRQSSGLDNALTVYKYIEQLIDKELEEAELLYQQYALSINLIKSLGGGYLAEIEPHD